MKTRVKKNNPSLGESIRLGLIDDPYPRFIESEEKTLPEKPKEPEGIRSQIADTKGENYD